MHGYYGKSPPHSPRPLVGRGQGIHNPPRGTTPWFTPTRRLTRWIPRIDVFLGGNGASTSDRSTLAHHNNKIPVIFPAKKGWKTIYFSLPYMA